LLARTSRKSAFSESVEETFRLKFWKYLARILDGLQTIPDIYPL
jgi:hypothetical protein